MELGVDGTIASVASADMPRFVIRDEEGETLGVHDFGTDAWELGDRIPMPPGPTLVVVEVIEAHGDELPARIVRPDE